jgi:antitoxin HicB
MTLTYPHTVLQQDGVCLVQFVELEEAFTEAGTPKQVLEMAQAVLGLVLAQRLDDGRPIPLPSPPQPGQWVMVPYASTQVAVLFRLGLEQENITLAEVARAMGTSWAASQRLENPQRGHHLKQLEKAARALGKQLVIGFEPLAGPQESSE